MTPAQMLAMAAVILAAQSESACAIARPGAQPLRGTVRSIDWKDRQVHVSAGAELWLPLDELVDQVANRTAFILNASGRPA